MLRFLAALDRAQAWQQIIRRRVLVTPYPVQDSDTTDFEIGAQNAKCKLTGVYFANKKDYPDAETQVRSKSKNRFLIGGKSVGSKKTL